MKLMLNILALSLVLITNIEAQGDNTTLVLLQVTHRHGARSVLQNYPNDPTPLSYWDKYGGTGQLTPLGMKQLYDYGQFIKSRYSNFLESYDRRQVYSKSTDYDRTLMSANCFLAGIFQPNSYQSWNPDLKLSDWLPIPIHTNDRYTDAVTYF